MAVLQRVVDTVAGLRGERLESAPLPGDFDLPHLCAIHRALFQDIFAWAGQPRIVDTEKRGQDFLPATGIQGGFRHLHDELKGENFLRGLDPEEFGDRLTRYWYCIYAVHVFRDGNSRAMRHFFAALAAAAGYRLDFSAIEGTALLDACRSWIFQGRHGAAARLFTENHPSPEGIENCRTPALTPRRAGPLDGPFAYNRAFAPLNVRHDRPPA
jgi:cell filamentation protein